MDREQLTPICATLDGHTIRCVQLKRADDNWQAQAYGYTPYLHTTDVDRLNLQQQLVGLREILATPQWGEFVGSQLVVNLPSLFADEKIHTVAFKSANQVDDELRAAAQSAADASTPTYFHHNELYQFVDQGGDMKSVYLLHFQPAMLHHHLNDLLQDLELETRVESSTAALAKLAAGQQAGSQLIVHMGVLSTKIMVWHNHLVDITNIPIGFEHLLKQVGASSGVGRSEAYKILTGKASLPNPSINAMDATLEPLTDAMTKAIGRTDLAPERIVISGDGARVAGLDKYLFETTRVDSGNLDPWQDIGAYPLRPMSKSLKPTFASALSLALH